MVIMKKKAYCASLFLLSSTPLYAASQKIYDVKIGDSLNSILESMTRDQVGITKTELYQAIIRRWK